MSAPWLAGKIPAVIREIVERSKLAAIRLNPSDDGMLVTDEALSYAAQEMQEHVDLLTPKPEDKRSETVKAADALAEAMRYAVDQGLPIPAVGMPRGEAVFTSPGETKTLPQHGAHDDVVGAFPESKSKSKQSPPAN